MKEGGRIVGEVFDCLLYDQSTRSVSFQLRVVNTIVATEICSEHRSTTCERKGRTEILHFGKTLVWPYG